MDERGLRPRPLRKNYAWCFKCVPEENLLLLEIDGERVGLPLINFVLKHPNELLSEAVFGRFGPEFPIRFDFLDAIDGGDLSPQVHPLADSMQKNFGMNCT